MAISPKTHRALKRTLQAIARGSNTHDRRNNALRGFEFASNLGPDLHRAGLRGRIVITRPNCQKLARDLSAFERGPAEFASIAKVI